MKHLGRLTAVLLCLCLLCPAACAVGEPELNAKAALLMERETGTILYGDEEELELEPASVTKVMTMLLVTEALDEGRLNPEDMVTTSTHAASMGGSQVYLKEGEQMSVDDLLKAVAVSSGNDAAVALAEQLGGSEEGFVAMMNKRAEELGMTHTHFVNCNGLPAADHYSCAKDIALMSRELLSHERIRQYTSIWMDTLRDGTFGLSSTNKLLKSYNGTTGLKTGSTNGAGYCISASAQREGMELIAVILGSKTSQERFDSAKALLDYGFGGWKLVDAAPEEPIPAVPVVLGREETVQGRVEEGLRLLLKREQTGEITTRLELADSVTAPVYIGDVLGTLTVLVDGEPAEELTVTAGEAVARKEMGEILRELVRGMIVNS